MLGSRIWRSNSASSTWCYPTASPAAGVPGIARRRGGCQRFSRWLNGCGPRARGCREVREELGRELFELRVKHFDRIFRVLYFYQPGCWSSPRPGSRRNPGDSAFGDLRAGRLRSLWLKYRNRYPESAVRANENPERRQGYETSISIGTSEKDEAERQVRRAFRPSLKQWTCDAGARDAGFGEALQVQLAERAGTTQSVIARSKMRSTRAFTANALRRSLRPAASRYRYTRKRSRRWNSK